MKGDNITMEDKILQAIHFSAEDRVLLSINAATEAAVPSSEKLRLCSIRFKL